MQNPMKMSDISFVKNKRNRTNLAYMLSCANEYQLSG